MISDNGFYYFLESEWVALCGQRWGFDAARISEEGGGRLCYLKYELQDAIQQLAVSPDYPFLYQVLDVASQHNLKQLEV